jgi:hypothetical protein
MHGGNALLTSRQNHLTSAQLGKARTEEPHNEDREGQGRSIESGARRDQRLGERQISRGTRRVSPTEQRARAIDCHCHPIAFFSITRVVKEAPRKGFGIPVTRPGSTRSNRNRTSAVPTQPRPSHSSDTGRRRCLHTNDPRSPPSGQPQRHHVGL